MEVKHFSSNPSKNWRLISNQRQFLTSIASKYQIKSPKEWGKLTFNDLEDSGCSGLLKKHGNSIMKMLQSLFPGYNFNINLV